MIPQANEYAQKTREGQALTGLRSYGSSGTTYLQEKDQKTSYQCPLR